MRLPHSTSQIKFKPFCLVTGLSLVYHLSTPTATVAQIIPDNTLGNESSVVVPNQTIRGINSDRIDGGAIRGSNLFHSFQEFNINNGQGVYFSNPENITNILTRITGNNLSNLQGTLGILGNANLFLINPNGIVFGPNARLDISGSFFASTADSILFENGIEFAASNPEAPPLLTINIPIGLQFRESQPTATIVNQGNLFLNSQNQASFDPTLGFIGGDIVLEGGQITAEQGNIELGSVGNNNRVKIIENENSFSFDYSEITQFQNIQLNQSVISVNSLVNAQQESGGNINIHTGNLDLNNSAIETVTFGSHNGGNINVNANNITATGLANDPLFPTDPENNQFLGGIRSIVGTEATGRSGNITVNTQQLGLQNGATVGSFVRGAGAGGDVLITAENIQVSGVGVAVSQDPGLSQFFLIFNNRLPSGPYTTVTPQATGPGGNLTVNTSTLRVEDSGIVAAGTFGLGESGDLSITAQEIEVAGKNNEFALPSLLTTSTLLGSGQGGNLMINTNRLSLRDGGQVRAGSSGRGDSGDVTVVASEIELSGRSFDNLFPSSISSNVGDLVVLAPELIGIGNAGNLNIQSHSITLTDGGEITASTFGSGDAGNILVNAREITASGGVKVGDLVIPSGLRVDVLPGATGNGGDLTVNTDRLTLRDGGQLSTNMFSTSETVQSGNLTVNATVIEASGIFINSASGLVTNVQNGASGNAGTLTVNTDRLSLRDGAAIGSLIAGTGAGGNIEVNAGEIEAVGVGFAEATNAIEEQILLFLGGIFPSGFLVTVLPTATGQGGNLTVNADRITVKDSAQLGTGTFGTGNSGDLTVRATEINVSGLSENRFPPTSIQTAVLGGLASGDGGNAVIEAQRINLSEGGQIRSGTSGSGNSGNLTVIAPEINLSGTSFDGRFPSSILTEVEDFSDVAPGVIGSGEGGNLTINSHQISVSDGAAITASSFGEGAAGSMEINADSIRLNQGILQAETPVGSGGNITLNIPSIELRNSRITTNATGEATGGSITINTESLTAINNSDITANAQQASGGEIRINADTVLGAQVRQQQTNASDITATSELGTEFSGTIEFNTDFSSSQFSIEFSQEVIDPTRLIAQNACQQTQDSRFVITGRGGLPQNPIQETDNLAVSVELSDPVIEEEKRSRSIRPARISTTTTEEQELSSQDLIPARGWIRDENGDVILVGYDPTVTQAQRNHSQVQSCYYNFGGR
ncbi:MAG: filamentous hemagglutinin N-terminal domain-containing protein [Microcoleaceae cyanobacterium]